MKTTVGLVHCSDYEGQRVGDAVRRAVDLAGGIRSFVKPGERILLKPNLLSAREPERAVTTHPEVVRAVARLVREAGAVPLIGDSPSGAIKGIERVWVNTGMKQLAAEEDIELINFETSGAVERPISHPSVHSVHLAAITDKVDGIINIPKLKTHGFTVYTCCVKNLYGCVPGLRKAEYHKLAPHPDEFSRVIAEIYLLLKPRVRLHVIDGIVAMEGRGPTSGDRRKLEMVWAGSDGLALDIAVPHVLGFKKPKDIETNRCLAERKAGESDLSRIEITGDSPAMFSTANFRFPSNWYVKLVPHFLVNFLGKHIWIKPLIVPELCKACMLCVDACPVKTIKKVPGGKPVVHPENCISCLCCHEICEHKAIEFRTSRLSKLFFRQ